MDGISELMHFPTQGQKYKHIGCNPDFFGDCATWVEL